MIRQWLFWASALALMLVATPRLEAGG